MCLGSEGTTVHMCSGTNLEASLELSEGRARAFLPEHPGAHLLGRVERRQGCGRGCEAQAERGRSGSHRGSVRGSRALVTENFQGT